MKQYKKYILSLTGIALILTVIIVKQYARDNPESRHADKYRPCLDLIAKALNDPNLEYTYTMTLYDELKYTNIDSVKGHLCKSNSSFVDSNSTGISMLSDDLFCRIDKASRQAFVCKLSVMENRLGIKKEDLNNTAFSITDSMLQQLGNLDLQPAGEDMMLTCTIDRSPDGVKKLAFVLDKAMQHLKKVHIVISDDNNAAYTRILTMSGFSNGASANIDPTRFFTIHDKKVILNKIYKDYKVKAAI